MTLAISPRAGRVTVRDVDLEVVRRGSGRAIVFLHGFQTLNWRVSRALSRRASVLAPSSAFGARRGPMTSGNGP